LNCALRIAGAVLMLESAGSSEAQTVVNFQAIVVPSCILTVSTPGVMTMAASGTQIGSEEALGNAATLGIVATGGAPTISFTAPAMNTKPAAYSGTPTVSLKYSSPGGANQAYTTGSSQYTSTNPLGDSVTLNAKAVDLNGFVAGTYNVRTTATCQQ
jgi:hypothetical protein